MISRDVRGRSGITLTEILIAILIMGVGLISLATLFPLGLIRLREATRSSRAGLTFETAADDMDTRSLFYKPYFTQTWYKTTINNQVVARDPFVQDALPDGTIGDGTAPNGVIASGSSLYANNNVGLFSGLPFCYDPLWRTLTNVMPNAALAVNTPYGFQLSYVNNVTPDEARFGAGLFSNGSVPFLRNDPDGNPPSAHGLQRLTNFIPWVKPVVVTNNNIQSFQPSNYQYPFTFTNAIYAGLAQPADVTGSVFTSNDDLVFNSFTGNSNSASSLIPDMSTGGPQADYRFTWFVTGRQTDAGGNGAQFTGEIVVCDGRPFGWDPIPGQTYNAPSGETVVEAIFGYGSNVINLPSNPAGTGFATGADKTVLIRWPAAMADPQVRVGGWICDVTYERFVPRFKTRSNDSSASFARCYWYQIGKRTDPQADVLIPGSNFRSMILTITSPLRTKTLLTTTAHLPVHVNVALSMPSVINVFPRAFEVH